MRTLVLGGDGYLGWPMALYLSAKGQEVAVLDNFARRSYDDELGFSSLTPICSLQRRIDRWKQVSGKTLTSFVGDLVDPTVIRKAITEFKPEAIVHFGE